MGLYKILVIPYLDYFLSCQEGWIKTRRGTEWGSENDHRYENPVLSRR